ADRLLHHEVEGQVDGLVEEVEELENQRDQDGQGGDQGIGENGGIDEIPDFSTLIAQQLQDLFPTIIAQVGNHASSIQGEFRSVNMSNRRNGCSYKEFMACNPKDYIGRWLVPHVVTPENKMIERYIYGLAPQIHAMVAATEPTTIQSAVLKAGMLTGEVIRNGSLRKNTEKRKNGGEPSRDGNVRDDHKRSRTRRAFAIVTNLVRKEYTCTATKAGLRIDDMFDQLQGS
ncbi:hypothetical protein Tco_0472412, partial [Tanacetum coccineum]